MCAVLIPIHNALQIMDDCCTIVKIQKNILKEGLIHCWHRFAKNS
jgi:hypothetical protein